MKDLAVGLIVILIIFGVCYGLATMRPDLPATPSQPFSTRFEAPAAAGNAKIIMRVNGEPVTEREFDAIVRAQPEQMRTYYMTEGGRRALAEEIVKLKALEQEGRRLGADNDADINSQLSFDRANVLASYAIRKMIKPATEAELKAEYEKNRQTYSVSSLSHILIAYQGGAVPPKSGGEALPLNQAMAKAKRIVATIRGGQNFGATAVVESDDTESAQRGGEIGVVSPDQLPPELAQAVMRLKPNQVSDPVQSRFGIHILQISERRPLNYARVKESLQQKLQQDKVKTEVDRLQHAAKVELDPSFFGAGKEPAPLRKKAS